MAERNERVTELTIVQSLTRVLDYEEKVIREIVDEFLREIKGELVEGKSVVLTNFVSMWVPKEAPEKYCRDFSGGGGTVRKSRKKVRIITSGKFLDFINQ